MIKVIFFSLAIFPLSSFASWDGTERGEIGTIQVTAGHNFAFRVSFKDPINMCGEGSDDWAFLNEDDSNYQAYISAMLAARFSQTPVRIYTKVSTSGHCRIGHIAF